MREIHEFRVAEEFASQLFGPEEGERLSFIRKVRLESTDPRVHLVGRLHTELVASQNRAFFHGWSIEREYTAKELDAAEAFLIDLGAIFEPAGEECGTIYDESAACRKCGAGAIQQGPLSVSVSRIPKRAQLAATIANEVVISRRLADVFRETGVTGVTFGPVSPSERASAPSNDWYQLLVTASRAEIVPPTKVGIDPFDYDTKGACRCEQGDLLGLALLSELSIRRQSFGDSDVVLTRQFVGVRRGLLRPRRLIVVSQRVRQLLMAEKVRSVDVEIARLVD